MAKKIAVLLDELVHEHEFIYPYFRLKEAGFESVSVATEKRVYKGKFGVPFTPDMLIADVTPGEFEGVIVAQVDMRRTSFAGRRPCFRWLGR